jgi:hypothetical protein
MTSTFAQIAAVVAGVALIATGLIVFPNGFKGLSKGLAVTISLAVVAAVLMTAARSFGP